MTSDLESSLIQFIEIIDQYGRTVLQISPSQNSGNIDFSLDISFLSNGI